ncbi:sugar phosphate isomerase/epimerase family protein [uncultured Tateyamaria sp.]|uniref:sugar phosphate isomerase/epimerase family protein n=1 Tax=uncultured Tateyamaria sp. TaxID=455651 RepID=UPI00260A3B32|nr:sugar phosphate isomerase/epimerase family protein [uncultured Tateyamaria sp.]
MKYGIHAGLWQAQWTDEIVPILRTVADLGFDGVEVSLLGMTDEKAAALGKAVRDHGLEVTCSDGLAPDKDITSDDADVRAAGVKYLQWAIETTAKIGSRGLAGVVFAPWGVFDPLNKPTRAARSAEALGSLDQVLADNDVTLGIEALNRFETDLVNTADEACSIARASGSDRVGALLDTFHLNMEEKDIRASIAASADKLVHFHVSDNDRGAPGSGHVPWDHVKAGLADANYNGWIVAEMFVIAGNPASADLNIWRNIEPEPTDAARRALAFMQETFG